MGWGRTRRVFPGRGRAACGPTGRRRRDGSTTIGRAGRPGILGPRLCSRHGFTTNLPLGRSGFLAFAAEIWLENKVRRTGPSFFVGGRLGREKIGGGGGSEDEGRGGRVASSFRRLFNDEDFDDEDGLGG